MFNGPEWVWLPDKFNTPPGENIRFRAPLPEMLPDWLLLPLTLKSRPPAALIPPAPPEGNVIVAFTISAVAAPLAKL